MPLQLLPCTESDLPDFQRIQIAAFAASGMTKLMKPTPLTSEYVQTAINKHLKSFREERDVHYVKVIDTDLGGRMIACAKWRVNEKPREEEDVRRSLPVPGPAENERPAARDFMNYLTRVRWEYMGTKPFYFLHILVTDPEHHRRGAGGMLIRWGTERADRAQLPAYLEATQMGLPLYAREGFQREHDEVFDLSKYGLSGTDVSTVMIREPLLYVM